MLGKRGTNSRITPEKRKGDPTLKVPLLQNVHAMVHQACRRISQVDLVDLDHHSNSESLSLACRLVNMSR